MRLNAEDVLREFEAIKGQANLLRQSLKDSLFGPSEELENLVEKYKDAKMHFGGVAYERDIGVYLLDIELKGRDYSAVYKQKALLGEIGVECDKAIEALKSSTVAPLSADDLEKLMALEERFETVSEALSDINYEINLREAITEYERGAYLASALIASRVILHALDKIRGESAEDKVQFLREKGIIGEGNGRDVHESLIKANSMARNLFSYDITAFPSSSDALSLLGDAVAILEIVSRVGNVEGSLEK